MSLFREKYRILPPENGNGETVVLIHGLFVGSFILRKQGRFFQEHGYRSILYDYPTTRREIGFHSEKLADFLNSAIFDSGSRIHFVTHSMGGLVLRGAVGKLTENRRSRLGRVVMIAPPNRGSDVASGVLNRVPGAQRLIVPLPDLSSGPASFANAFPVPENMPETGIIGAERDHQVKPEYTHLAGEADHIMLRGTHTGILFRQVTAEQAYHFILFGRFKEESDV